jgi:hypothetical protein
MEKLPKKRPAFTDHAMKSLLLILLATTLHTINLDSHLLGGYKLTLPEAERILGEPCHLKQSMDTVSNGGISILISK